MVISTADKNKLIEIAGTQTNPLDLQDTLNCIDRYTELDLITESCFSGVRQLLLTPAVLSSASTELQTSVSDKTIISSSSGGSSGSGFDTPGVGLKASGTTVSIDFSNVFLDSAVAGIAITSFATLLGKENIGGAIIPAVKVLQDGAATTTSSIGTLGSLATAAKSDLVSAINEVNTATSTNAGSIGTLVSLTTTANSDLVSAVNEVNTATSTNTGNIATLQNQVSNLDLIDGSALNGVTVPAFTRSATYNTCISNLGLMTATGEACCARKALYEEINFIGAQIGTATSSTYTHIDLGSVDCSSF